MPFGSRSRRTRRAAGRPRSSAGRYGTLSGGRLLRRAYVPGSDPGINDSLVPQQGPNYALAKRLQRWRATLARRDGGLVSMNVAPPTRTRSVFKNRALAAAYAGAHRFGRRGVRAATSNVLMAALLVHDLKHRRGPVHASPGRTRRTPPRTAGSGDPRTHHAACSGSPPWSALRAARSLAQDRAGSATQARAKVSESFRSASVRTSVLPLIR